MNILGFLLYKHECLLENKPLVKFIPNHMKDLRGIFFIFLLVKIDAFTNIPFGPLNYSYIRSCSI